MTLPRLSILRWLRSGASTSGDADPQPDGDENPVSGAGAPAQAPVKRTARVSPKARGDAAEAAAQAHLQQRGLRLLARNWRGPGRGGGELDLVMQALDGTLVFVEVRARRSASHGGAGASITARKRSLTVRAARHYLQQWLAQHGSEPPPCRFDVVLVEGEGEGESMQLQWLPAAFDAE